VGSTTATQAAAAQCGMVQLPNGDMTSSTVTWAAAAQRSTMSSTAAAGQAVQWQ